MEDLRSALDRLYVRTNRAACNGTNPYLKFSSSGSFRVITPALDEVESEPLRDVMLKRSLVPLSKIHATVDQHCGMLGEFRH